MKAATAPKTDMQNETQEQVIAPIETSQNVALATTTSGIELLPAEESEIEETHAVELASNDAAKALSLLDNIDSFKSGIPLNATYFKFEAKGEVLKGIFCGVHKIPANDNIQSQARVDNNGMIDTVRILRQVNGKREMVLLGDIIAVTTLSQMREMIPVEITYLSDEKGKTAGTYKNLRITQLF